MKNETLETGEWALWRICLKAMRESPTFGYGAQWDTSWFESMLCAKRDTSDFAFNMLDLRQELESHDGYYLESNTIVEEATGIRKETWSIPSAAEHGAVSSNFESKMRRYARRSLNILEKTLTNPTAKLEPREKAKMEKQQEIAATRLVLLAREKSIANYVRKANPKMLSDAPS